MNKELYDIIINRPESYAEYYIDNADYFIKKASDKSVLSSVVNIPSPEKGLDRIRFASVFSDLTNLYFDGITKNGGKFKLLKEQTITVKNTVLDAIVHKNDRPILNAAYSFLKEEDLSPFLKKVFPLIYKEKLIVHNNRVIMGLSPEKSTTGNKTWNLWEVKHNSPTHHWFMSEVEGNRNQGIPIDFRPVDMANQDAVFEITIPYLSNVPIKELDKILEDYQDLLSQFRFEIKNLINNAINDRKTIEEIKFDLLQPKIDSINQKFKKISNIHKLKVKGTVFTTVSLSFVAGQMFDFYRSLVPFILGLGVMVRNEADYQKEIGKLYENPFYFLWKVNKYNSK